MCACACVCVGGRSLCASTFAALGQVLADTGVRCRVAPLACTPPRTRPPSFVRISSSFSIPTPALTHTHIRTYAPRVNQTQHRKAPLPAPGVPLFEGFHRCFSLCYTTTDTHAVLHHHHHRCCPLVPQLRIEAAAKHLSRVYVRAPPLHTHTHIRDEDRESCHDAIPRTAAPSPLSTPRLHRHHYQSPLHCWCQETPRKAT